MTQPRHKMPSPREAAELAKQMEQLRQAGLEPNIEMTPAQFREFKRQLWWGREVYSGLGLTTMFPGLGTKRSFATKLADPPAHGSGLAHEDGAASDLAAGFECDLGGAPSGLDVGGVLDGDDAARVIQNLDGAAPGQQQDERKE